jgi:hypothetical protein
VRRTAFRSSLAILASLSTTGLVAAFLIVAAVAIHRVQEGTDVVLVYAFPILAVVLVVLPLRIRLLLGRDGLVVQNLVVRHRIPWDDVESVVVSRLSITVLFRLDFFVPGVVVRRYSTIDAEVYATWGLRLRRRRELALALSAAAAEHGFRSTVDEAALAMRGGSVQEDTAPGLEGSPASGWVETQVECVFCGRAADPSEMEPFGDDGEELRWYCRDEALCEPERRRVRPDVLGSA